MAYARSDRLPLERASKLEHMRVIQEPSVQRLLDAFVEEGEDDSYGEVTGRLDLAQAGETCARHCSVICGHASGQRSRGCAQHIPAPLSRASITTLLALFTLPPPSGYPWATKVAYLDLRQPLLQVRQAVHDNRYAGTVRQRHPNAYPYCHIWSPSTTIHGLRGPEYRPA